MISKAQAVYIRISPRKVRYVIDLIRNKPVTEAQRILSATPRRGGEIIEKLLNAALDAAEKNSQIAASQLKVSKVLADGGPTMRRFRAGTMGRGMIIRKRTSHIYLELDLLKKHLNAPLAPQQGKAAKKAAPSIKTGSATGGKTAAKKPAAKKKLVGAK